MLIDVVNAARIRARAVQESLYDATCTVTGFVDYLKPSGATAQREEEYITNQPCKLVKKAIATSNQTDAENNIFYTPQLFISPELEIKPGSRIAVTQIKAGRIIVSRYEQTGVPAVYDTHQEVLIKLADKKA